MVGLIIFLALLTLLLLLLSWILFAPIILRIDTTSHEYFLQLKGLLKTWMKLDDHGLAFCFRLPVYQFTFYPFDQKPKKTAKKKATKPEKKKKSKPIQSLQLNNIKNILQVLRSFQIKQFEIALDTDDYVINAQLVPAFWVMNRYGLNVSTNFLGQSYCTIEIRNTVWRMGIAYLGLKKF